MGSCSRCNEDNQERARYCWSCGAALIGQAVPQPEARKTVTVVFCDITGSTALAERLDPESLHAVMTRYYLRMREVLERHGGTVREFLGDGVMAVFGVPVVHEDDPLRAIRASVEMVDEVQTLNLKLERSWGVTIQVHTGVNTGEVVAGDPLTSDTLVVGDAVNVASRLENSRTRPATSGCSRPSPRRAAATAGRRGAGGSCSGAGPRPGPANPTAHIAHR
jgi:class 3 adenylate cyclase